MDGLLWIICIHPKTHRNLINGIVFVDKSMSKKYNNQSLKKYMKVLKSGVHNVAHSLLTLQN
jgi:hypothetical protein